MIVYQRMTSFGRAAAATGALVVLAGTAGCSSDSTNFTGSATTITAVVGSPESGVVGTTAGDPFIFKVTDASGNPVQGAVVNFTVSGGGATLANATATSDVAGVAFTSLVYGHTTGLVTVTASLSGTSATATLQATALPGDPTTFVALNGSNQSTVHGTALPDPIGVQVTDQYGNGVPGISVAWSTTAGTVTSATTRTDASGRATDTATAGTTAGTFTITATALIGGTTKTATFTETSQ